MEQQAGQTRPREAVYLPPQDDEISLVDLWLVLIRHKWVVVGLALLGLAGSGLFAASRQPTYTYATVAEIGGWWQGTGFPKDYSPVASAAMIRDAAAEAVAAASVDIQTDISKDGRTVTLTSKSSPEQGEAVAGAHQAALTRLGEIDRLLEDSRLQFEAALNRAEQRLASLEREIDLLNQLTGAFEKSALQLVASDALARNDSPLLGLSERLFQAQERLKLAVEEQKTLTSEAQGLRFALASMEPTRRAGETVRTGPSGPAAGVIVALGAVLGLFAGLFGAFFAEFLKKVREAQAVN